MWGFHEGMGWWMVFGAVWMTLFWAAVIGLVVWGIRSLVGGSRPDGDSALEIASRRYARGEISREEFERLRQDLAQRV